MTRTLIFAYYVLYFVSRSLFSFCLENFLINDFRRGRWTILLTVLCLRMPCALLYFWRICSPGRTFLVGSSTFLFSQFEKCDTFLWPKGFDKEFIVIQTDFPSQEAVVSISLGFFPFVFDFISLTIMGLIISCWLSSLGFAGFLDP